LEGALASSAAALWRVPATACIAGPYALSDTEFPFLLQGASDSSSTYLAYLVTAYQHVYGMYEKTSDAFNEPYASIVDGLFDGQHTTDQISQALPRWPRDLFRPDFLARGAAPGSPLMKALAANDALSARPRGKVHLYFGQGDVDVSPNNAERAYESLSAAGVDVALVPLGTTVDHPGSEAAALPLVKKWFDELSSSM
jgi:hypothetical protein